MLFAHSLRVHGRKAPILALWKETVGRSAHIHSSQEEVGFTPGIVTVPIDSDRQIEIEERIQVTGNRTDSLHLLVGTPLDIQMIAERLFGVIARLQMPFSKP